MKRLTALILAPVLILAANAGGQETKNDSELFQGKWKIVSWEAAGGGLDADTIESWRFVFTKDKYEFIAGDNSEEGLFKLDFAAKPKKIDLAIKTGNDEGKAQVGIYQFDKDKLKVCFARAGEMDRPKEFAAQEDPVTFVLVLEREKAEKK